jgi:DNA repair protein RadC
MAGTKLKDQPLNERPRERLRAGGPDALKAADLIAILLRTGVREKSVTTLSEELVARYKTLHVLGQTSWQDLAKNKGIGPDKAVTLVAAFALARLMIHEKPGEAPLLDTPEAVANCMREEFRLRPKEVSYVLLLNVRRRLLGAPVKIADGTLDTILVHPRDVFKPAIEANAAAIVLIHNHPSGDPAPSEADIKVTRDLIRAGHLLKIELLDHIVMGRQSASRDKDYVSLRELGYFAV